MHQLLIWYMQAETHIPRCMLVIDLLRCICVYDLVHTAASCEVQSMVMVLTVDRVY